MQTEIMFPFLPLRLSSFIRGKTDGGKQVYGTEENLMAEGRSFLEKVADRFKKTAPSDQQVKDIDENVVGKHMIVHGKVQGVGFRHFTKQQADYSGIKGWVRNNMDGTVEIEAAGTPDNLESFTEALKEGNGYSKVENIETEESGKATTYRKFQVKY